MDVLSGGPSLANFWKCFLFAVIAAILFYVLLAPYLPYDLILTFIVFVIAYALATKAVM